MEQAISTLERESRVILFRRPGSASDEPGETCREEAPEEMPQQDD